MMPSSSANSPLSSNSLPASPVENSSSLLSNEIINVDEEIGVEVGDLNKKIEKSCVETLHKS